MQFVRKVSNLCVAKGKSNAVESGTPEPGKLPADEPQLGSKEEEDYVEVKLTPIKKGLYTAEDIDAKHASVSKPSTEGTNSWIKIADDCWEELIR